MNWFGHLMPLALALVSNDDDSVINGSIVFLRSKQLKCSATWCFWSCETIEASFT